MQILYYCSSTKDNGDNSKNKMDPFVIPSGRKYCDGQSFKACERRRIQNCVVTSNVNFRPSLAKLSKAKLLHLYCDKKNQFLLYFEKHMKAFSYKWCICKQMFGMKSSFRFARQL